MEESINYQHEWILAVSEAMATRDADRLYRLQQISDGWMSPEDERVANSNLVQVALEMIDEIESLEVI